MPISTNGKNVALNALGALAVYCSLHEGIPDSTGSNEISGGSPAYARKALVWASASGGSMSKNATDPVLDVPAGKTIYYVGFWSALTTGTFYGYAPINGGGVKGVGTAATSDVITSNGHGLVDTDRITLQTVAGEALPTGLSATVVYFVVSGTTDTFKVALTSGGAAVDITAVGELAFQKVIPEVYASQGTFTFDDGSLDLNG